MLTGHNNQTFDTLFTVCLTWVTGVPAGDWTILFGPEHSDYAVILAEGKYFALTKYD